MDKILLKIEIVNKIAIIIFIIILSSCAPHWRYSEILYHEYDDVWNACLETIRLCNYTLDSKNKEKGYIRSNWQYSIKPFGRLDYRSYIVMEIVPAFESNTLETSKSWYRVRLNVPVEKDFSYHYKMRNYQNKRDDKFEYSHDRMMLRDGFWVLAGYDKKEEILMLKVIESKLYLLEKKDRKR